MNEQSIIGEVVRIILTHAKPARIYLYGSRSNGQAGETSDIDIAYDDEAFHDHSMIEEEVDKLNTLLLIDVKNLASTGERFRSRVKSTGRVLYSADKKLRAEDGIWNFTKAHERLVDAIRTKEALFNEGFGEIYLDLIVKRFEFTFEMSWKAIKRFLDFVGIESRNPRSCFKEAYSQGLIEEESVWLDMIESRTLSSRVYDQSEISFITKKIGIYQSAFSSLLAKLQAALNA